MSNTTRQLSQRQRAKNAEQTAADNQAHIGRLMRRHDDLAKQFKDTDKRTADLISAVGSINAGIVRFDEANTGHQKTFNALAVESERTETELLDKIEEANTALASVETRILDKIKVVDMIQDSISADLYGLRKDYDETATRVMLLKWTIVFILIAFAALWWAA